MSGGSPAWGMLVGALVAVAVHAAGWLGQKRDQPPTAQGSGASGDADA